ncbi:Pleiotropic negative transcriptional regulator [Thoreauomyces humboldtii]|nr:Pleiotropic negative transcriptional regulator [Thoreauomyces humboldtii]
MPASANNVVVQQSPHTPHVYRTIDRIQNFRLRIKLEKIADANAPLPLFDNQAVTTSITTATGPTEPGASATTSTPARRRRAAGLPPPDVVVLSWGVKVYSPSEILSARDPPPLNASKETARQYEGVQANALIPGSNEAAVLSAGAVRGARTRIYTRVAGDGEEGEGEEDGWIPPSVCCVDGKENDGRVAKGLRSRQGGAGVGGGMRRRRQKRLVWERSDVVADRGSGAAGADVGVEGWEEMHVLAELDVDGATEGQPQQVQVLLCSIRAYDSGLVTVAPRMTNAKSPHRFTVATSTYQYTLKNESATMSEAAIQAEHAVFQEIYKSRQAPLMDLTSFQATPPPLHHRTHITGEIHSHSGFPARTPLYVRYLLSLPPTTMTDDAVLPFQVLSGTTQLAKGPAIGMPLEWCLVGSPTQKTPKLVVAVCGLDGWGRGCVLGYGWCGVPEVGGQGRWEGEIKTWRPVGTVWERVKGFLVGGGPELEDLEYVVASDGKIVNKYGFRVESSGSLRISLNVVRQAVEYQVKPSVGRKESPYFAKGDVRAISDALARARARVKALQEARVA